MSSNRRSSLLAELGLGPEFPVGVRVLVIDSDERFRGIVGAALRSCQYEVSIEASAMRALDRVFNCNEVYDIVVTEIANLDVEDVFLFLDTMTGRMPVVVLSNVDDLTIKIRAFCEGRVVDYMVKAAADNNWTSTIWHHVLRRRISQTFGSRNPSCTTSDQGPSSEEEAHDDTVNGKLDPPMPDGVDDDDDDNQADDDDHQNADGDPNCNDDGNSGTKKERISWDKELHRRFAQVVKMLGGPDEAKPKKILQLMNNPLLTRESVASHLQKYRLSLKNKLNVLPIWMDEDEVTPSTSWARHGTTAGGNQIVANPYLANYRFPPNGNIIASAPAIGPLRYQMPIHQHGLGHGNAHYRQNLLAQPSPAVSPAMHRLNSGVPSQPPPPLGGNFVNMGGYHYQGGDRN